MDCCLNITVRHTCSYLNQVYKTDGMKEICFACFLLIFCYAGFSQECTEANVGGLPGKWKLETNGRSNNSKADIGREREIMDGVNETFRKNFAWPVVGGDIRYGSFWEGDDHRPSQVLKVCNIYYTRVSFNHFFCSAGKINHEETADIFYTNFNELPFHFEQSFYMSGLNATDLDTDPGTDVYAILYWLPEAKDGYLDYVNDGVNGTGEKPGKIYRYRILTKPGKQPYLTMDKKEYYEKWIIKHQKEIVLLQSEKAKMAKELAGNDQLPGILKQHDQYVALTQNWIDKIETFLKTKSAEELAKPAYYGEELGEYFESRQADDYLRAYIIKPNYAYYNNRLPKSSPQVITLCFRYNMGKDEQGNRVYSDEAFYKALINMNIFDLLTEKLKPQIEQ